MWTIGSIILVLLILATGAFVLILREIQKRRIRDKQRVIQIDNPLFGAVPPTQGDAADNELNS